MIHEECFRKELREDLVKMHVENNNNDFLKVVEKIIKTDLENYVKAQMIENKLKDFKIKMQESINLFC